MIEINLIEKKRNFKLPVILGVDLAELNWKAIIISVLIYNYVPDFLTEMWKEERAGVENQLKELNSRDRKLRKELKKNRNIKEKLVLFNQQIKKLKQRTTFVDKIIKDRTNPRHVLEKIARSMPKDVWLERLEVSHTRKLHLRGGSVDFKSIGDFIVEANESPFFGKSLQLKNSKTLRENKDGKNIRVESFHIEGDIKVFNPYL